MLETHTEFGGPEIEYTHVSGFKSDEFLLAAKFAHNGIGICQIVVINGSAFSQFETNYRRVALGVSPAVAAPVGQSAAHVA